MNFRERWRGLCRLDPATARVAGIVDYVMDGSRVDVQSLVVKTRSGGMNTFAQLCWLWWILLALGVLFLGVAIVRLTRKLHGGRNVRLSMRAASWLACAGYVGLILMVLNTI